MFSGFIRGVTTTFTVIFPRAEETSTQSPDFTPIFWPRVNGISQVGSGISSLSQGVFRVVDPPVSTGTSGKSYPVHFPAFSSHHTIGFVFGYGLPSRSQDARL